MIGDLIILAILVAVVYFVLKKFTVYRCPECRSIHVTKHILHHMYGKKTAYKCSKCGSLFTKDELIKKGED